METNKSIRPSGATPYPVYGATRKPQTQASSLEEDEKRAALRAERLVRDRELSRAMTALTSEPLAPNDDATYAKLVSKHPSRLAEERPNIQPSPLPVIPLKATEEDITAALSSFHRGSSGGAFGLRPEHVQIATEYHNDERTNPLGTLTKFTNHLLSGRAPEEVQPYFAGGRLCALHKGEHDVRPIAAGETLRRLASKVACLSVKEKARKLFSGHQFGVAIPAGIDRVIHLCRLTMAEHCADEDFVFCKVDLRNAFNHVSRNCFISLTRKHFPELSAFVEWCYATDSSLTFGDRTVTSSEGVQQGDPLGPFLFSLVMQQVYLKIHDAAPKLDLNMWYLDDGILSGRSSDVRHALDVIAIEGPKWGLHLNSSKCELITNPAASDRLDLFPDIPGLNKKSEGNLDILGSPIGSTPHCRRYLIDNAVSLAEESLDAIEKLEDPQVALSLIRHCTGFCQMVHTLRTTPATELQDLCQRLDNAVQHAAERFVGPLSGAARRQAQRDKRYGGFGLRSAESHATSAYVSSVASASSKDLWDPMQAQGFESAVRDVNSRAGYDLVSNSGRIIKPPSPSPPEQSYPESTRSDEDIPDAAHPSESLNTESRPKLVIPRQRELSQAISSHEYELEYAKADARTRARWVSQTGKGASEWAFVTPSKNNGHAFTPTEFRILTRWWLGNDVYPKARPCPMDKCGLPLGPEGDHALSCKSGHGIIARHNALARQFSLDCNRSGLTTKREVSLDNTGPGGGRTRPADVFIKEFCLGQGLVLDFAVTNVQQTKYTDLVRDANLVEAGSFAERYATEHKQKQREEAEAAKLRFAAMAVESYGSWSPSAMAVIRDLSVNRSLQSANLSKADALHELLTALNITLMRSQARMMVLRSPPTPDSDLVGYGSEI